jgi:mono/diheme cytochrome c family protein
MIKIALAGSAVALIAVTLSAVSPVADGRQKKAPSSKDLYATHCQMCHGVDGKAPVPEMGFVGRKWKTKTAAEAVRVITEGVPGTAMLPFDGKLTTAEIRALARYVRALDTPEARKKK